MHIEVTLFLQLFSRVLRLNMQILTHGATQIEKQQKYNAFVHIVVDEESAEVCMKCAK